MHELSIRIDADDSGAAPALARTERGVKGVETAATGATRATATFGQRLKEAMVTPGGLTNLGRNLRTLGSDVRGVGTTLSIGITAPLVAMTTAAIKFGSEFQRTLNQVQAVTNATDAEMRQLTSAANEWGAKTKFSNTEAAEALLELSKAGFNVQEAVKALPNVLALATAAELGLGDAATTASNVMHTFGLQTSDLAHANDILVTAANMSTINVSHLAESIKFVGPVARAANISLADTSAVLAKLGEAGIKAEMAGTGFRGMLTKLLAPTKATREALDSLGFGAELAAGKTVSWVDLLNRLHDKMDDGQDVVDKYTGVIMKGFGQRAGPAVLALAQTGGDAIKALSAQIDSSVGSADRMSEAFMKGLPGAMERFKGAMETASASLLTTLEKPLTKVFDLATKLAEFVTTTLVPAFMSLPEPVQTAAVVLGALAAAVGPLLIAIGGILSGIGTLVPLLAVFSPAMTEVAAATAGAGAAMTGATAVAGGLTTALEILTGPIGWVIAGVTALIAIWWKWGDDIKAVVSGTISTITGWIVDGWGEIKAVVNETISTITGWIVDGLAPILEPLVGLFGDIKDMFVAFGELVFAVHQKVIGYIATMVTEIIVWIVDKLKPIWSPVVSALQTVGAAFKSVYETAVDYTKRLYEGVKMWLVDKFGDVVTAFKALYEGAVYYTKLLYEGVKTWLVDKFVDIINGAREKVQAVTGFFKDMYDKVVGHSYVPDLIRETGSWFDKLEAMMVAPTRGAVSGVLALFDQLTAGATGKLKTFFDMLKGIAGQIFGGGGQGGGILGGLFGGGGSNPITSAGGLFGAGAGQNFTLGSDGSQIPMASAGLGNAARFGGGGLMAASGIAQLFTAKGKGANTLAGLQAGAGIGTMIMPGIGTAIGAGVGALAGFLKGVFSKDAGRKMVEEFGEQFGGLDPLHDKLLELGDAGDLMWKRLVSAKGKDNATRQIQEVTEALQAQQFQQQSLASAFDRLGNAVAGFGNRAPAAMRPLVTELLGMKGLTGDMKGVLDGLLQPASWQSVGEAADRLGVKFDKLGKGFNQERISASALQMVRDLDLIKDAGADMNGVLADAAGNINKLVNDARNSGVALPETLKPYIQKLIDLKLLVAPNGELVTNIDDLSFADIEDQGLKDIKHVLEEIRDLLKHDLPDAVSTASRGFAGFKPKITVGVDYDYSALDPRRYIHGGAGAEEAQNAPGLASGGIVRARPGGTLVRVGEGGQDEAVTPLDGRSRGGNIYVDARGALFPDRQSLQQFGKVIAPHVASGALSFVSR